MGLSLWITIICICCVFYNATGTTVVGYTSVSKGTTMQTSTYPKPDPQTWTSSTYVAICVPIAVLLAAIIITVLVVIYRRKRGGNLLRQESNFYGNSGVSGTVGHNGYKTTEKKTDNYDPKPCLTPNEEPIYINIQHGSSQAPSAEGDRTENIYCNVGYATQQ